MWPEPELRTIIRPEPELKNRNLHSTSQYICFRAGPESHYTMAVRFWDPS